MKQFYAFTAVAVFFSLTSFAQFSQDFEGASSLTSDCNSVVNSYRTTTAGEVITGAASLYCNPPVTGAGTRDYSTPYLNFSDANPAATSTTISVSFNYKLNQALTGLALRTIQVGYQNASGFTALSTINMDKDNDPVTSTPFSQSFSVPTGPYRIVLKMGGSQGNGAVRIILDDLMVSESPYYSLGGSCNTAPSIQNDFYSTPSLTAYTGSSVLANDNDANGESLGIPTVTTPSPDGTVIMNNDGSFSFTANAGFTGTSTSFTYTVYDSGFDPLSGSATVTIYFGAAAPLPVKLVSFQGSLVNHKVQLNWTVAENQSGNNFVIEKSADGKSFSSLSTVFNSARSGEEVYQYTEPELMTGGAFYRIKMVGMDHSVSYSRVIFLKSVNGSKDMVLDGLQNPIRSAISFSYTAAQSGRASVAIYNMTGARVQTFQVTLQKGSNVIAQPVADALTPGTYILEVTTATERNTARLIK